MRMRHTILLSLACPSLQYFSHIILQKVRFSKKKRQVIEHKMCVLISSKNYVWNISHFKKSWAAYYQQCILVFMSSTRYFCQALIKLEFSWHIFEKKK